VFELIDVKDNIDDLKEVMDLIYEEWGKYFRSPKEEKLRKIRCSIEENKEFPKVYVLRENDIVIGSFMIKDEDLKGSNLSPWLSCVVIKKEYRGKGYGKILLDRIKKVIDNNYKKMYLFTHLDNFYEKIGFVYVKDVDHDGEIDKLYEYKG